MDAVVNIRDGKIRGSVADGVYVFKGIPYAAAPYGVNRFRPPQPVEPWSGVRDALTYGPKAPQLPYPPPVDVLLPELATPGEDCLNLNIWSSELGAAGRPVMVWIPGGGFEFGTGASPWCQIPTSKVRGLVPDRRHRPLHRTLGRLTALQART